MATPPADSDRAEVTLYAYDPLAAAIWLIVVDVCPSGTWPNIPDALSNIEHQNIEPVVSIGFVYVASY
jgi:hypothetical protein